MSNKPRELLVDANSLIGSLDMDGTKGFSDKPHLTP